MVEPAGSSLVALSPPGPPVVGGGVPCSGEQVEETLDFGDGEWDEARIGGWLVVCVGWRRWWCCRLAHGGGGDGANGHGCHGEDEVAFEGRVEPDLAVVESEVVLADLEIFLYGPTHAGDSDQGEQRDRAICRGVGVEVGQVSWWPNRCATRAGTPSATC
jgi:hypothetical protein